MPTIKKILVANRGEIAVRVLRTCKDLGIKTVAVFSDADKFSPHVLLADESVHIGEAPSSKSYLVTDKLIQAAKVTDACAIHPGYGFLSENPVFSKRCADEGIIFIGPAASSIEAMGDKTRARELMIAAGVPLPPGTTESLNDVDEAARFADSIGYPVMIKAAAGGGGKGMRIVYSPAEFSRNVSMAQSEALSAFGDDRVYVEKYLESPHHIEFQVLADMHGNVIHLFDRECSIQRRHQKVVEESPSMFITEQMRSEMADAAVKAARSCNYTGAGTIEFLVDKHRNFYFLEMNTRLQVEHPVTEMITGTDLVALQILVAEGKPLPITQDDVKRNGHAIECRICAEDPFDNFLPSTGYLKRYRIPAGPGVRVDSGVEEGQEVSIYYDPLLAKLITWGSTRHQAIQRMKRALSEYDVSGIKTTIPFCSFVMDEPSFVKGDYDTHFVKEYFDPVKTALNAPVDTHAGILGAVLLSKSTYSNGRAVTQPDRTNIPSAWWANRRNLLVKK
ncbi:MAG: acetyl-CoA carboxylase biotin carboxylase subunit [Balneolaceae bacterium]|nr:MAG: acetyl-CoA carboxylase biotin carboxylase subunit [Balneolaceae bacterium]